MTLSRIRLSINTLARMTFNIMTLSIKILSRSTLKEMIA
jgi:hypothetical protein